MRPKRLQIVREGVVPPHGWEYVQPETGFKMNSVTPRGLMALVEVHRRANGIPLSMGWKEALEEELCRDPRYAGRCREVAVPRTVTPRLRVGHLLVFLAAVKKWFKAYHLEPVPVEEADRRANICMSCPKHVPTVSGCPGCEGVFRRAKTMLSSAPPLAREKELRFCGECLCFLPVKVRLPADCIQAVTPSGHPFPEGCWIKPIISEES